MALKITAMPSWNESKEVLDEDRDSDCDASGVIEKRGIICELAASDLTNGESGVAASRSSAESSRYRGALHFFTTNLEPISATRGSFFLTSQG